MHVARSEAGRDLSSVVLTIRCVSEVVSEDAADATMAICLHSLEVARWHVGR
jgi:hypothetical protein